MWNPFKKNKAQQQLPAANRVDELANRLQREGRLAELESELENLGRASLSNPEQEAWWHLYGIVAFQQGRDAEALYRFKEGYERFPESVQIRFSLGQQYERARDIKRAFDLFSKCRFPEISCEFVLAQVRFAYLWNRYDDGREFLRPFFDAYKQLTILDDNFLYMRGLPFFSRWWSYLAAFSVLSGDWKELEGVTKYVVANCRDYDFEHLQTELRAYRDGRPELLVAPLEKRLQEVSSGNFPFPTGYTRMKIAVAKARMSQSESEAEATVNEVKLTEQDFPWLEDIRAIAKAEIAHRFDRSGVERERVAAFLGRQPLLFEPDIALNFHLLKYQENLKPWYQERNG